MTKESAVAKEQVFSSEGQQLRLEKSMPPLEDMLGQHPFLEGVGSDDLKILARGAHRVCFERGQFLFYTGNGAHLFYLIDEGRVEVGIFGEAQGSMVIQTLGPDDVLGWSCLVPPYQWHFDAKAAALTHAIALDGKALRARCERDHDLGYEMLKRLSFVTTQRLEMIRLRLVSVSGRNLKGGEGDPTTQGR